MTFSNYIFMALAMALSVGQTMSAADLNQFRESYSAEVTKYSYHYLKYLQGIRRKEKVSVNAFPPAPANEVVILSNQARPTKIIKQGKQFPFIVISPQCPKDSWWDANALDAMVDQIMKTHYS